MEPARSSGGTRAGGRFTPPLHLLLGFIALSFFGTLALAAALFPMPYDPRFRVISSLANPHDNPHYYWIAGTGLAVTGILLLPFAQRLWQRCSPASPVLSRWALWLNRLGSLCLLLTGIIPGRAHGLGVRHPHVACARLAGFFLGLAFIFWMAALVGRRAMPLRRRWKIAFVVLALLPTSGVIVSRIALNIVYASQPKALYDAYTHTLGASLALWEWLGALCIYLFLVLFVVLERNNGVQ